MANPHPEDLRSDLAAFVRFRQEHMKGDEKGEAQVFLDRLFKALGHEGLMEAGAVLEMRIKKRDNKGTAFADLVWKPRCLIEMKKAGTDLAKHYRQAFDYWVEAVPDRPRYVVLCNFDEFWIYDFDTQLDEPKDRVRLVDLPRRWDALSFLLPRELTPVFGNDLVAVTRDAAVRVATVFTHLHQRGIKRHQAQRFVLQSVMAMFAEDIGLLPNKLFTRALEDSLSGEDAYDLLFGLFREMNTPGRTPGGRYRDTPYFNGGLFADITPFELSKAELENLHESCRTDWSAVRPEIFGTLFEQSMAQDERHAYGAHFTSQADIVKVVGPTIVTPWRDRIEAATTISELDRLIGDLYSFRVLDPACGSGNFLYVAYRELRRIEHEIQSKIAERRRGARAGQRMISYVSTDHFYGIDINDFAVEIAKVTMMLAKQLSTEELEDHQEVLPLDNLDETIVAADALFVDWPNADVIIGNPPYLGRRKMVEELGAAYCRRLAERYPKVSGVSDYVSYWFPLTHDHLPKGGRAGLVATNSIRQNESRAATLDYVVDHQGMIFNAVSTQPWSGDAAVYVSIVNWSKETDVNPKILWLNDGKLRLTVNEIPSSLSPNLDVRKATALLANERPQVCFQGVTPGVTRAFVLDANEARISLTDKRNENVIYPFLGGKEMLQETVVDRWIIDISEDDVTVAGTKFPSLMAYLEESALPERRKAAAKEAERNTEILASDPAAETRHHHESFLNRWWQLGYRRGDMLKATSSLDRYIATCRVASTNRASVFTFVDSSVRPGDSMTVFAFSDDYSLGILSSDVHQTWLRARCSSLKGDPRYTSTTVFDSFPWPQSPDKKQLEAVASRAAEILELRESYLLQGISLAKQYDSLRRPGKSQLRNLHAALDHAVFAAYGFADGDDVLAQLLALNQSLASDQESARGPGGHGVAGERVSDYRILAPTVLPQD